jgi:hypothetical protein
MISLDLIRPTGLKLLKEGAERILVAAFCGNNRPPEFAEYQQRVFARLGIPLNHILVDFSRFTHGAAIDYFLTKIGALYDYLVLFDTDAVPLKPGFIDLAYEKIRDKRTLFGLAQQSNHIFVNGSKNHVYVGPGTLAISRSMYIRLGRPTFQETIRSDAAEELTWRAEELGYTIALVFPSHVHERLWDLGNGHCFGVGTTYGDSIFHAFQQGNEKSLRLFIRTCKAILKTGVRASPAGRGGIQRVKELGSREDALLSGSPAR